MFRFHLIRDQLYHVALEPYSYLVLQVMYVKLSRVWRNWDARFVYRYKVHMGLRLCKHRVSRRGV